MSDLHLLGDAELVAVLTVICLQLLVADRGIAAVFALSNTTYLICRFSGMVLL